MLQNYKFVLFYFLTLYNYDIVSVILFFVDNIK